MFCVPARLAARLTFFLLALLAAPTAALSQEIASAAVSSQGVADSLRTLLTAGGSGKSSLIYLDAGMLGNFYATRLYQPAWTQSPAALASADLAIAALQHADDEGLQPDRYHLDEIQSRRNAPSAQGLAELELFLTDGMVRYARDLRLGQGGLRELDSDVSFSPDAFDPATELYQALRANRLADFLASLPPPHPEYRYLKAALAQYRAVPGDPHVPAIIANMERWRWAPRSFGPRYISVNIASATLDLVDGGKVIMTSPVIAGKPDSRTPLFSAVATGITFNPSWHVPTDIIRREILPGLRADPNYLARKHMVRREGGGIRQLPGAGNALGLVKFEMPNEFDAYLHDTPMRALFASDERHLSHGCVRVQKIQPLASFAMTGDLDSGLDRIRSLIMSHATRTISLDQPLPVFVMYWTAIADADGAVNVLPDVYGRDQRLLAAMAAQHLSSRVTMNFGETSRN